LRSFRLLRALKVLLLVAAVAALVGGIALWSARPPGFAEANKEVPNPRGGKIIRGWKVEYWPGHGILPGAFVYHESEIVGSHYVYFLNAVPTTRLTKLYSWLFVPEFYGP